MTQQHPIAPPPELVQQWVDEYIETNPSCTAPELIAARAAEWAADRELEACVDWMKRMGYWGEDGNAIPALRAARRPKPPSLKEQALAELAEWENIMDIAPDSPIRRALEQLPDPS